MGILELLEFLHPFQQLLLTEIVLPGTYQAAINQGIPGEHHRLDARQGLVWWLLVLFVRHGSIVLQPLPQLVRIPQIALAAQKLIRRHYHLVAQLTDGICRFHIRNRPVIVGNKHYGSFILWCLFLLGSGYSTKCCQKNCQAQQKCCYFLHLAQFPSCV